MQLAHSGIFANPTLTGQPNLGVSPMEGLPTSPGREMSREDIRGIVKAFGEAATRAVSAGFDGVQLHAAHGYLLSQVLSPHFNARTDEYGGSIENRARMPLEALAEVRKAVGPDRPVWIKMNCQDYLDNGLDPEDAVRAGILLAQGGADAIELSGGTFVSGPLNPSRTAILSEDKEAYFRDSAKVFRQRVPIPLSLVGGIRSLAVAEGIVREGMADYVSMSRPFIREPWLVKRWKAGDTRRALCLSDNQCFGPARAGEGIYCVVERKEAMNRTS
jgi:2,4-dienoyl-CoA reductase-like NADH-dependent reductase (Old Yellow Enzyme family)